MKTADKARTSAVLRTTDGPPTSAEILADLARVKAVFQLRTISAIVRGGGR